MKRLKDLIRRWLGHPNGRLVLAGGGFAAACLMGGVAHAGGGGVVVGHGHDDLHIDWWTFAWHAVDLVVFVGLIVLLARKPVAAMFQRRHDDLKAAIEQAQSAYNKAKAHADEYAQKLARVDAEVKALVEGATQDGRDERDHIIAQAKDYSQRLRGDTQAAVEQEAEVARRRLRNEMVQGVLGQATALISRELSQSDRERLLEEAIAELENGSGSYAVLEDRSAV